MRPSLSKYPRVAGASTAFGLTLLACVGATVLATAPAYAAAPIGVMAGQSASIPLPDTAEEIEFDGVEGSLAFKSASSVADLAAFFRAAMKPLGWSETPSVINNPKMSVLIFGKGGKTITLTVMLMGDTAQVEGQGDGLATEAAKSAAEAAAPVQAVEADEMGGLPVPKDHSLAESDSAPFRHGANARTSIDLKSVLAFYRTELTKRGWTEQPDADVKTDKATVAFVSPDGPAVLKLSRDGEETVVGLAVRDQAGATKSGLLPKPGQVKAMFGNMAGAAAVFTLDKKSVKVAVGVGSKGTDGPTLDLAPGKYTLMVKVGGQAAHSEPIDVGADEIWGFMAGPGGVLPVQMY